MKNITKEEYLQAVKDGVKEAILTMTESGDGYNGPIRKEEFFEAIKNGVDSAFPSYSCVKEAITEGITKAFPYPSEIQHAILDGTENAIRGNP